MHRPDAGAAGRLDVLGWLLLIYVAGAILSIACLMAALYVYERRLRHPRPFRRLERRLYHLGILFDIAFNFLTLSVVFLEPPASLRETASRRFMRHMPRKGPRGFLARLCWRLFILPVAPDHINTVQRPKPYDSEDA